MDNCTCEWCKPNPAHIIRGIEFSDSDLKRLKEYGKKYGYSITLPHDGSELPLFDLLAWLEASENYHIERDRHAQQICGHCINLREACRKAAGK